MEKCKKGSELDFADKLQTRDKITISVRQMSHRLAKIKDLCQIYKKDFTGGKKKKMLQQNVKKSCNSLLTFTKFQANYIH